MIRIWVRQNWGVLQKMLNDESGETKRYSEIRIVSEMSRWI